MCAQTFLLLSSLYATLPLLALLLLFFCSFYFICELMRALPRFIIIIVRALTRSK